MMAIKLRSDQSVKGIVLNNIEIKLSQYAGDATNNLEKPEGGVQTPPPPPAGRGLTRRITLQYVRPQDVPRYHTEPLWRNKYKKC